MPVVHKFGGSALTNGRTITRAAAIVASSGAATVVVVSALAGVTDSLLRLAHGAAHGSDDLENGVTAIYRRHLQVARESATAARVSAMRTELAATCADLLVDLQSVRALGQLLPQDEARISSLGEKLAGSLVAAAIDAAGNRGVVVDACHVMAGVGAFTDAAPDHERIRSRAGAALVPLLAVGVVPVVPGFYGINEQGHVVTFGRGGSDLTAASLGRALRAAEVVLWKDVPGLLSADPRVVENASRLRRVSLLEAAELSRLGAKVLHGGTIDALGASSRLCIRAFADPDRVGTTISALRFRTRPAVKAVTATECSGVATIGLIGEGAGTDAAIAARALSTLGNRCIEVMGTSAGTLGHSLRLKVDASRSVEAQRALHDSFQLQSRNAALRLTASVSQMRRAGP